LRKGEVDAALAGLYHMRTQKPPLPPPRASEVALLIGNIYFDRKWWTDALKEYRFAVKQDPRARGDMILVNNTIRMLADRGTAPRARRLLLDYVGKAAVPSLKRAVKVTQNPLVRHQAQFVLASLDAPAKPVHRATR
jgi:hypothetical protein